jgi:flagellar basal body rod protein FlgC
MDKVLRNKQAYDVMDDTKASNVYYDPSHPASNSTLNKLATAEKHGKKTPADLK